jgi:small basic protein
MKIIILSTAVLSFLLTYFLELSMDNAEQFLAVAAVVLLDGFFGVIAGVKREGFKTYKALNVLKSLFTWIIILTCLLMVEKGFTGTSWLSETIIVPFIIFQVMSALKNASMSGFIKNELLNIILDKIDKHKGERA